MFLKLLGCLCIALSSSGAESQEARNSFNSGYDSRFSNYWNSNNGFPVSNNGPFTGNTNNAGSNFFNFNENKFSSAKNEKNFWDDETLTNTDQTSDWNHKKSSKASNDGELNAFNNRPSKKKLNSIMNLPNSSKWNENSNTFTSNSNSNFSSWGYNNAKPSLTESNKRPESWNSNEIISNETNGNDRNHESDYEDKSVYPSWNSNNSKKTKSTLSSYSSSGSQESKSKNFGTSKWEANNNRQPQKASESNLREMNNSSQLGREKSSPNSKPSVLDKNILDKLDKNDWYFGKESNYPKPPFRSTLNIDVSELWNFDKNRKTSQNSGSYENGAKINNNNNNNNNNRRNREIEHLSKRIGGIHCECVNVNFCEEEDMIIREEDVKFQLRPLGEFICESFTEVCCTNPKIQKVTKKEKFTEKKGSLHCGEIRVGENHFESFGDNIAEPGEFPWILRLEHAEIICGASLIHPKMALTAAHCVTSARPEELILKAGAWNSNNEPFQNRLVTKIIQHPDYNSRNPRNDIALLVLEIPFELTDNVNTICLPMTDDVWDSNQCIVADWRSEEIRGQDLEVLAKEVIDFLPQTECQNMMLVTDLWRNYILHDSFICGLGRTVKKSCAGDEGGFVICPFKNRPRTYLQIGIISMGINCDNFGRPGIFTNVLKFLDWINQNYFELGLFDETDIRSFK